MFFFQLTRKQWKRLSKFATALVAWSEEKCLQWIYDGILVPDERGIWRCHTKYTSQLVATDNTDEKKTCINRLDGFWSSRGQTQTVTWLKRPPHLNRGCYLCCPDRNLKPWRRAVAKWEKTVTGSWKKCRAVGQCTRSWLNRHFWHWLWLLLRNIFLWRSCLGGWATWHKHRFGYVNMHFFFLLYCKCTPL